MLSSRDNNVWLCEEINANKSLLKNVMLEHAKAASIANFN